MAIREKTVTFVLPNMPGTLPDAITTPFPQITLRLPEAAHGPIVFKSVMLDIGFQDASVSATNINTFQPNLRLDTAPYTNLPAISIINTGENLGGVIGPYDCTSYFTTNWGAGVTEKTVDVTLLADLQGSIATGLVSCSAVIHVTYTYDDTAPVQIKTVRIPLQGHTAFLPNTKSAFGTISNQIPALLGPGGFLPEAGVTLHGYNILLEGNDGNSTTTDVTLSAGWIGEGLPADYNFMPQEAGLASDRYGVWVYTPEFIPDPTSSQTLAVWCNGSGKFTGLCATLVVTYEFTLAGTTRVCNSIILPYEITGPLGCTTAAFASRYVRDLVLVEPGNLELRQSAFRLNFTMAGNVASLYMRAGNQNYINYSTATAIACGMYTLQRRIDTENAGLTAGFSLTRGVNRLTLDFYHTNSSSDATNVNGVIFLNYHSDVSPQGIGAHAKTCFRSLTSSMTATVDRLVTAATAFDVAGTGHYWMISAGFNINLQNTAAANGITFDVASLPGEGKGGGYLDIYADVIQGDAERGTSLVWAQGRDVFKRCPQDADPERVDIRVPRVYRLFAGQALSSGIFGAFTYHSMTWSVAGNLTGADLSQTTKVTLFRARDDEKMQVLNLLAGQTTYGFVVYDDTEDYYVLAEQGEVNFGRSSRGKAS